MYINKLEKDNEKLIANAMAIINTTKYEMDKELNTFIEFKSEIKNELGTYKEAQDSLKDNMAGLSGRIDQIRADISENKNQDGTTVVFNVYSYADQTLTSSQPVIFDRILQNQGNGYDKSTGIFTAPVGGIYQFNANLCANKDKELEYAIFVSGVKIVKGEFRASSNSVDLKCTSFSAASLVSKGEKVSVRGYTASLDTQGDDPLSFSGALIKEV
ncbi:hypothetical protein ACF0H5_023289 [Mactra antiquata]